MCAYVCVHAWERMRPCTWSLVHAHLCSKAQSPPSSKTGMLSRAALSTPQAFTQHLPNRPMPPTPHAKHRSYSTSQTGSCCPPHTPKHRSRSTRPPSWRASGQPPLNPQPQQRQQAARRQAAAAAWARRWASRTSMRCTRMPWGTCPRATPGPRPSRCACPLTFWGWASWVG